MLQITVAMTAVITLSVNRYVFNAVNFVFVYLPEHPLINLVFMDGGYTKVKSSLVSKAFSFNENS